MMETAPESLIAFYRKLFCCFRGHVAADFKYGICDCLVQISHRLCDAQETLPQTCGNIVAHLIFSTKGREPLIRPEIRADLFAYLGGIIREMRGTALIINGTADHVHVLARIRPAHSAAQIARVIKTNSSRWVHEKGHIKFAWQAGYGVFSVSESNVGSVTKYIAAQEAHHQKHSFQEEFLAFLKKNNVAYDERYIWD